MCYIYDIHMYIYIYFICNEALIYIYSLILMNSNILISMIIRLVSLIQYTFKIDIECQENNQKIHIITMCSHYYTCCQTYSAALQCIFFILNKIWIVHGLKMFNFTSDTMMLDDACTCIFLIREVFHFALVDWSTLKFLQGKARALINHPNVYFICRVVGKYWFSG